MVRWESDDDLISLHVTCHVRGGLIIGTAGWRESIFRKYMPLVLELFINGDQELFQSKPEFDKSRILIHFHHANSSRGKSEDWGRIEDYC